MITTYGLKEFLQVFVGEKQITNRTIYLALGWKNGETIESATEFSEPNETVAGYKPSNTTYHRVVVNSYNSPYPEDKKLNPVALDSDGKAYVTNSKYIEFPECFNTTSETVEDWTEYVNQDNPSDKKYHELTHVGIFDALTGGNLLMWQELTNPIAPGHPVGDLPAQSSIPLIRTGKLKLTVDNTDETTDIG